MRYMNARAPRLLLNLMLVFAVGGPYIGWNIAIADETGAPATVRVRIFTMPMCPYGNDTLRDLVGIKQSMGNTMSLEIYYIADEVRRTEPKSLRNFESLHGTAEVLDGIATETLKHLYPDDYLNYLAERTKHPNADWRDCAKRVGLNATFISACMLTDEALLWYSQNIAVSHDKGIRKSPTVFVNDEEYRRPAEHDRFLLAICNGIGPTRGNHPECLALPECFDDRDCPCKQGVLGICESAKCSEIAEPTVGVTVLTSNLLDPAHLAPSIAEIRRLVPSIEILPVTIESDEGKTLTKAIDVGVMPVFVFDPTIVGCRNYPAILEMGGTKAYDGKVIIVGCPIQAPFPRYGAVYATPEGDLVYDLSPHMRASALHAIGEIDKAEENYKKYIEANPEDPAALSNLGALYVDKGDYDSASFWLKKALIADPEYQRAYDNLYVVSDRLGSKEGQAYFLVQKGWALNRKEEWPQAVECFEEALDIQNDLPVAHLGLGTACSRVGRYSKALTHLEAARRAGLDNAGLLNELAGVLWRLKRPSESVEIYRQALAKDPQHVEARGNLAYALHDTGDIQEAISVLLDAPEEILETNPSLLVYLVELYCAVAEYSNASQTGNKFLGSLGKDCPELLYWTALGDIKSGTPESAKEKLLLCAKQNSDDLDLTFHLGSAFLDLRMYSDAAGMFQRVLEISPANSRSHAYLSLLYALRSDISSADAALDHAELAIQFGFPPTQFQRLCQDLKETHTFDDGILRKLENLALRYK